MKRSLLVILGLLIITSLYGCSERDINQASIQILNSDFVATDKIKAMSTVYMSMESMEENSLYSVTISDSSGLLVSNTRYTTDADGNLGPIALWNNAGVNTTGNAIGQLNPDAVVRTYTVQVQGSDTDITLPFFLFNIDPDTGSAVAMAAAADALGNQTDSFVYTADSVFLWAQNIENNTDVDVYIIRDADVSDGDGIQTQYEVMVTASYTASSTGSILAELWASANYPAIDYADRNREAYINFDIIIDINQNGIYEADVDLIDGKTEVGFTLQDNSAGLCRIEVASGGFRYSQNYGYKDTFFNDGSDTIYGWVRSFYESGQKGIKAIFNPYIKRSRDNHWHPFGPAQNAAFIAPYVGQSVDVYILNAIPGQVAPTDNAVLVDVSGQGGSQQIERMALSASCQNGVRQITVYPAAFMTNGDYWLVVDLDQDGEWDADLDFIDSLTTDMSGKGFSIINP